MFRENEKFIAFLLLGAALVTLALTVYLHPLSDTNANSSSIQIINTIVGALTLAFGGAANALFRINDAVRVNSPPSDPVHTDAGAGQAAAPTGAAGAAE